MTKTTPHVKFHHHNDYLISFYAGRDQAKRHLEERNWLDDSALKLGTAMYAIHSGAEAIVYDTFASMAHAEFVRSYLEKLGVRKFTAVLSHWHLDHIAGNAVFDDGDIIATSLTRDALVRHKADIEAGKVWGPPPIKPLRLPNLLFEDRKKLSVGEIALELRRMNIHSIDGCVVYLPRDKLLLAGDTLEDPLTYMIEVENLAEHLRQLREMKGWDVARILPDHVRPGHHQGRRIRQDPDRRDDRLGHQDANKSPRRRLSRWHDGRLHRRLGGEGLDQALRALPGGARAKSQARPRLLEGQEAA
jgi:cyclase